MNSTQHQKNGYIAVLVLMIIGFVGVAIQVGISQIKLHQLLRRSQMEGKLSR